MDWSEAMAAARRIVVAGAAAAKKPATKAVVTAPDPPDKVMAEAMANAALRPSVNGAAVVEVYAKATLGELDFGLLVHALMKDLDDVWAGDLKRAEAMLYSQAQALQAIFTSLARRATNQEYLKQWEAYLRMALKAQSQCRMTLETLALLKDPPVVYARQANINNGGQQQVNNQAQGAPQRRAGGFPDQNARARAPAGIEESKPNKLLEQCDGERMDTRAAGTAGAGDPQLAPVGELNRTADC